MEKINISQIVLTRIKDEGIKPISRNLFSIKRVLFWVIVGLSFIVGAFSFALVLSALLNNDWDLLNKFGFNFIFKTLPYFWLISLALFTILGEYYYRKTLFGHRRGFFVIVGVYLVSTTLFGLIFYLAGIGNIVEDSFSEISPGYRNVILNRMEVWSHPEEGLLSGKVIFIGENEIQIVDPKGTIWIVNSENYNTRGKFQIEVGRIIKIMGDLNEDNVFKAEEIRPWIGSGVGKNVNK